MRRLASCNRLKRVCCTGCYEPIYDLGEFLRKRPVRSPRCPSSTSRESRSRLAGERAALTFWWVATRVRALSLVCRHDGLHHAEISLHAIPSCSTSLPSTSRKQHQTHPITRQPGTKGRKNERFSFCFLTASTDTAAWLFPRAVYL
jgi:hypothetical protein